LGSAAQTTNPEGCHNFPLFNFNSISYSKLLNYLLLRKNKIFRIIVIIYICTFKYSLAQAAIFDVEAHGVYGGFWRDLYKFGPVVIDTVGGDLGVFIDNDIKMGFSFATVAGLISGNQEDDVFDAVNGSYGRPDRYSGGLNALEPADFSYSTAALKLEYILYDGSTFGWSTTGNFGQGVFGQGKINNASGLEKEEYKSFSHTYASLGLAIIIKITNNFRMSFGISNRKDLEANDKSRPEGFENFDAVTIYNHVYMVKF
jgi:hypothetical protein